jgi:hypothetical protein
MKFNPVSALAPVGWAVLVGTAREIWRAWSSWRGAPLPTLRACELPRQVSRHIAWLFERFQVRIAKHYDGTH